MKKLKSGEQITVLLPSFLAFQSRFPYCCCQIAVQPTVHGARLIFTRQETRKAESGRSMSRQHFFRYTESFTNDNVLQKNLQK